MASAIKILTHNAKMIYGDGINLQEPLQRKETDIAFICETMLRQCFTWKNPGYRIFRAQTHLTGVRQ